MVSRAQSRMPLRKKTSKDHSGISCDSHREVTETQDDNTQDDQDEQSQSVLTPTATREKRLRQRENKLKPKEMTEEEMMDLALRLSEQEANITAQRLQEEEEAVRRAIQDSMMSESQSQSLIAEGPLYFSTRRKLVYSNGESQARTEGILIEAAGTQELNRGPKPKGGDQRRNKKRRRVEGSPLMEMPDLSQPSASSSESVPLGSPQICDLTQIEDCDLRKSPVCQATVHVPRLSQNLLDSCNNTGFILCTLDSSKSTQNSPLPKTQRRSPTFSKSPHPRPNNLESPSQTDIVDLVDDTETNLSPELGKSPVFGSNAKNDSSSCALNSETNEASGHMFSSQESLTPFSLEKEVDLINSPVTQGGLETAEKSPVFGTNVWAVKTSEDKREDQEEAHNTSNLSETELTSDMTLRWSDEEDNNVTPVASPSPVFPQERTKDQAMAASDQPTCNLTPTVSQSGDAGEVPCFAGDTGAQSTVHYYWGVPFCPRGLNPDQYTKVIVAQMEVYEKSLKQAQRRLMKKVDWGEPVLPQPEKSPSPESNSPEINLTRRRLRRRRGKVEEPQSPVEDDQEDTQEGIEEGQEEEKRAEEDQPGDTDTQVDSDCAVCPETQLSDNDSTQDLTLPPELPAKSPDVETVQVDSPAENEPQQEHEEEAMEVESEQDPNCSQDHVQSRLAEDQMSESQSREDPGLQRSRLSQFDPVPSPPSLVQCPICLMPFLTAEIEMHAALCDGEPAVGDGASPRLRRKRARQRQETSHTTLSEKPSGSLEKCYVCHRTVPLREYRRHTEKCLQQATRTTATGGLLSALDQSEHRDSEAGPSGSRGQPPEVIDLLDDEEDDEEDVCEIRISNSPIRSFTSISEAEDCLIDFKQNNRANKTAPKSGPKRR